MIKVWSYLTKLDPDNSKLHKVMFKFWPILRVAKALKGSHSMGQRQPSQLLPMPDASPGRHQNTRNTKVCLWNGVSSQE